MMNEKKRYWPALILCLVVAAIFLVATMSFQAKESEFTVVKRFGKATRLVEPGLAFKWPTPIEETQKVDRRVQTYVRPLAQTALKELESSVMLSVYTLWRVKEPLVFIKSLKTIENADDKFMDNFLATPTVNTLSQYQLQDLVNVQGNKLNEIKAKILDEVQRSGEKYGVEFLYVGFKQLNFPPNKVTDAVISRMRSERELKATEYRLAGRKKAQQIVIEAKAEARKTIDLARSQAQKIRGEGEAEAVKYYEVFAEDQELAVFLSKLDAVRDMLKGSTTLILDTSTPPFDVFSKDFLDDVKKEKSEKVVK